jgi:hypothetical protein
MIIEHLENHRKFKDKNHPKSLLPERTTNNTLPSFSHVHIPVLKIDFYWVFVFVIALSCFCHLTYPEPFLALNIHQEKKDCTIIY